MNEFAWNFKKVARNLHQVYVYNNLKRDELTKIHTNFYDVVFDLCEKKYIDSEKLTQILNMFYLYQVYLYDKEETIPNYEKLKSDAALLHKEIASCLPMENVPPRISIKHQENESLKKK